MDYGKLLTRAFEITYKYRALWLFGFLLALFGGNGGSNFNFPSTGGGGGSNGRGNTTFPGGDFPTMPTLFADFWQNIGLIILLICCFVIVLVLLSIVVRFISRAALIGLVQELETAGTPPTIRRGFGIGRNRFVPQLGIALVFNIPLVLFSLVVILIALAPMFASLMPLIQSGRRAPEDMLALAMGGVLGSILLICCVGMVIFVVQLIITPFYEFILRACVINQTGVMESIRAGYQIVRANLGQVAVLYLLQIGIGIGLAIVMIPIVLVLIGIPTLAAVGVWFASQSWQIVAVVGACLGIPMILVMIFVSGLVLIFESTLWTEGYLALTAPKLPANTLTPNAG